MHFETFESNRFVPLYLLIIINISVQIFPHMLFRPSTSVQQHTHSSLWSRFHVRVMSYVADTFASCLTHPFPSEGDIACENDSSNLYVNPLDGSGGGGVGGGRGVGSEFSGVRKSASGDGSVLCAKGSQGEGSPRGSRGSLAGATASAIVPAPIAVSRPMDASRTSLPQPLEDAPAAPDDAKPKHRKARFQQVRLNTLHTPKQLDASLIFYA